MPPEPVVMKPFVLKCPQCGAQLEGNRTLCEHCGTSVRLSEDQQELVGIGVACPRCAATNQHGDNHCGKCGEPLTYLCPSPSCHQENSVWRKFCRKCGRDIVSFQISLIEDTRQKSVNEMQRHQTAIDTINQTLPASRGRVLLVRSITGAVGALVALGFIAESHWIVGIICALVTAFVVHFYDSSEIENLQAALALHTDDLARLQEKHQASEAARARIKGSSGSQALPSPQIAP